MLIRNLPTYDVIMAEIHFVQERVPPTRYPASERASADFSDSQIRNLPTDLMSAIGNNAQNRLRECVMTELDGFHLKLICSEDDLSVSDPFFQAELKTVLEPLSGNECGIYHRNLNEFEPKARLTIPVFIPLNRAMDPTLWKGITNWISGQPGRALKLRYKNLEGEAQAMEEIVPILERTLKALTVLVQQGVAPRKS